MFNLEESINKWRQKLEQHQGIEPGYIEELESHLRDKIETLVERGLTNKEAFHRAVQEFEDTEEIADEYHKARSRKTNKPAWKSSGWIPTMLPSYVKMALRVIRKQKQFSVINTLGLSIGLACCLLIFLYIFHQLQFDQFHPQADNLFRITYEVSNKDSENHYAVSVPGLIPTLQETYPEIEQAVRVSAGEEKVVEIDSRLFNEQNYFHADSTFFDLFGFSLTQGNPQTALVGPGKVVLSQKTAEKYFGTSNPIGKTIAVTYGQESVDLEVSGVAALQTEPSHFEFDLLASFETLQEYYPIVNDQNWWMRSVYSYVKLSDQQEASSFQNRLPDVVENNMTDMIERSGSSYAFHLQPVTDIHLYSHLQQEIRANGNILYVYLFGSIALLVLLIACFNYMNLATARYAQRATEVGVRKSLGASRWTLVKQFMGESLVFTLMAVLLSMLLAWIAHPILEQFTGQTIHLNNLSLTWITLGLPLVWLVTGVISGSYPALFLSGFESSQVLKGTLQNKTSQKNKAKSMRKIPLSQ